METDTVPTDAGGSQRPEPAFVFDTHTYESMAIGPIDTTWLVLSSSAQPGVRIMLQRDLVPAVGEYIIETNNDEAYFQNPEGDSHWIESAEFQFYDGTDEIAGHGRLRIRGSDTYIDFDMGSQSIDQPAAIDTSDFAPQRSDQRAATDEVRFEALFEVESRSLPVLYDFADRNTIASYATGSDFLIVTYGRTIAVSRDAGNTWNHIIAPNLKLEDHSLLFNWRSKTWGYNALPDIHIDGDRILLSGALSAFSRDRGRSWAFHFHGDSDVFGTDLTGSAAIGPGDLKVTGLVPEGFILESGARWSILNTNTGRIVRSFDVPFDDFHVADGPPVYCFVSRDNDSLVFYDATSGALQRFIAGSGGLPADLRVGKKYGDTIVVGSIDGFYISRDDGNTFQPLDDLVRPPSGFHIEGIATIERDSIVLRLGGTPPNPNFIWTNGFGRVPGTSIKIRRVHYATSNDGGRTWDFVFFDLERNRDILYERFSRSSDQNLRLIRYVEDYQWVAADDSGILYRPNEPFDPLHWQRSRDNGETWEAFDPYEGSVIWIKNRGGRPVFEVSRDRGETWQAVPFLFSNVDRSRTGVGASDTPLVGDFVFAATEAGGRFGSSVFAESLDTVNRINRALGFRIGAESAVSIESDGGELAFAIDDTLYYSNRDGTAVRTIPVPVPEGHIRGLEFADGTISVALKGDDRIYFSPDYGRTWSVRWEIPSLDPGYQPLNVGAMTLNVRAMTTFDGVNSYALATKVVSEDPFSYIYELFRTVETESGPKWVKFSEILEPRISHPRFDVRGNVMVIHHGNEISSGFHFSDDAGETWSYTEFDTVVPDRGLLRYIANNDYKLFPIPGGMLLGTENGTYRVRVGD